MLSTTWFETELISQDMRTNIIMIYGEFRDNCVDVVFVIAEFFHNIICEDLSRYVCVNE
jgi:hypothetical protein